MSLTPPVPNLPRVATGFDVHLERDEDLRFLTRLECGLGGHLSRLRGLSGDGATRLAALAERCRRQGVLQVWPQARCWVAEHDGLRVGRLWADEGAHGWCLIDVSMLPAARGRGLGAQLLAHWLQRADAAGMPVHAHLPVLHAAAPWLRRQGLRFAGAGSASGVARFVRERPAGDEPTVEIDRLAA